MLNFSAISVGLQLGLKVKLRILLTTFIQSFEHAKCIAIDIFNLMCWALSD